MLSKLYLGIFFAIILSSCTQSVSKGNIVYMDSFKVFEEFQMKKDYDVKLESDLKNEIAQLDSLSKSIENKSKSLDTLGLYKLRTEYYFIEQNYNNKFQELSQQYTREVNSRLNEYVKDYSKKHSYDFVLGNSGQGTIMYADSSKNITESLIKYINEVYEK